MAEVLKPSQSGLTSRCCWVTAAGTGEYVGPGWSRAKGEARQERDASAGPDGNYPRTAGIATCVVTWPFRAWTTLDAV